MKHTHLSSSVHTSLRIVLLADSVHQSTILSVLLWAFMGDHCLLDINQAFNPKIMSAIFFQACLLPQILSKESLRVLAGYCFGQGT